MLKIVVEYKVPSLRTTGTFGNPGDLVPYDSVKIAEHEVSDIDTAVAFREGAFLIYEKGGRIVGYSIRSFIRFWSDEVKV